MRTLVIIMLAALALAGCNGNKEETTFYTVTFNANGGNPTPAKQTIEAGETATAPAQADNPKKQGYVFLFWSLDNAATPSAYNFQTPVNSNITLIAQWQEEATVEYWQVSWNLNGGAWAAGYTPPAQVVKGATLSEPTAPTKAGSTFEGWYREAALTNKVTFPYSVSGITANFTLYAKWGTGSGNVQVTSLSIDKNTLSLYTTDIETLTATVAPANATIQWTTSDPNVAIISVSGEVKATGAGTAEITASAGDKQAKCSVTVTASVFVAGRYENYDAGSGIVWKNGVRYDMKDRYYRDNYRSIFVYDGDVYVAGDRRMGGSNFDYTMPALWKNGEIQLLETDARGVANEVFVSNGDVYVAGRVEFLRAGTTNSYYYRAALWKNGKLQMLTDNTFDNPYANSVFVQGSDVYVVGRTTSTIDYKTVYVPALWKNGQLKKLIEKEGSARSITISGGVVYVSGNVENGTLSGSGLSKDVAALWINDELQLLEPDELCYANSVCVNETDVYVAGSGIGAVLWTNRNMETLSANGALYSVFVYDDDVYAAGHVVIPAFSGGTTNEAALWKNGERQELSKTGLTGYSVSVFSVFVK